VAAIKPGTSARTIMAIFSLVTDVSRTDQIFDEIIKMPEILTAYIVIGRYNIVISAAFPSMTKLSEFQTRVNSIDGVKEDETLITRKSYNRVFGLQEAH
jgi:DNA-binding Lrp family transcriptional regulator